MSDLETLIDALTVVYELAAQQITPGALAVLAEDLLPYGLQRVLAGLDLCRREFGGKLTPAVIIEKIQQADGRPGVGEAWAIAIAAADERNTVVWTPEIAQAWALACPLYGCDKFGARKAFEEAYQRAVRAAISECRPVTWRASIGWDNSARDTALNDAVTKGLLTHDSVAMFLPAPEPSDEAGEADESDGVVSTVVGLLTGKTADTSKKPPLSNEEQRRRLAEAREAIYAGQKKRAEEAARRRDDFNAKKAAAIDQALSHPLAVPHG